MAHPAIHTAFCDLVGVRYPIVQTGMGWVATTVLLPQVVDAVDIPVLAAGSLVDGRGLAAALSFGAQGVWMGTRFIASEEANAAKEFKDRILASGGADTRITRCYSGKPMRVISNAYVEDRERDEHFSHAHGRPPFASRIPSR